MSHTDLRIKTFVLGQVGTNCYLIYREGGAQALIIDPADDADYILNQCRELGVSPMAILLTHGHFDHVLAVEDLCRTFKIPVYAGKKEGPLLENPSLNLSGGYGEPLNIHTDVPVSDGDDLKLIGIHIKVLETPGHTAGSVCYWIEEEEVLISGDTLFEESLGRTDFPTGNTAEIVKSIKGRLFSLPEDTVVYPGHGNPTTIGHEKQYNPVAHYRG